MHLHGILFSIHEFLCFLFGSCYLVLLFVRTIYSSSRLKWRMGKILKIKDAPKSKHKYQTATVRNCEMGVICATHLTKARK